MSSADRLELTALQTEVMGHELSLPVSLHMFTTCKTSHDLVMLHDTGVDQLTARHIRYLLSILYLPPKRWYTHESHYPQKEYCVSSCCMYTCIRIQDVRKGNSLWHPHILLSSSWQILTWQDGLALYQLTKWSPSLPTYVNMYTCHPNVFHYPSYAMHIMEPSIGTCTTN